ncbi:hypothetical protein T484DRAFT_1837906 [Baffinella frigidus]|nr:hypothetical protein T484DRAFT_1837906 [Cryptophyta sp. CCMP2293]
MSLGRKAPGYSLGAEVELYDLRMFVHNASNGVPPLTAAQVAVLADESSTVVTKAYRCFHKDDKTVQDRANWKDNWGHDCRWFRMQTKTDPGVCLYPPAVANCPVSCRSKQLCLTDWKKTDAHFIWDRIRRIEPLARNGTLCLSDDMTKQDAVAACHAWSKGGAATGKGSAAEAWFDHWVESRDIGTRQVDLSVCEQLEAAIDEECAFNSTAVKTFSQQSVANNGDFTISFWVKATGEESNHDWEKRFIPSLLFYSSLSPPQHNLHNLVCAR